MQSITLSYTPEKAMLVELVKAYSVTEKLNIVHLTKLIPNRMRNLHLQKRSHSSSRHLNKAEGDVNMSYGDT